MPTSTFDASNSAIVIGGFLAPAASFGGTNARQFKGSNFQLEFTVTGTECVLRAFSGDDGTVCTYSIDGGAASTFPDDAAWSDYTLFTGLSDTAHTVKIRITNTDHDYFYIRETGGITVTGAAPAIGVTSGLAPALSTLDATFQSNTQREGGWRDHNYAGNKVYGAVTVNTLSVFRLRTSRASIKAYVYCTGQTYVVTVDGSEPDAGGIVTIPNTSVFEWVTLATGLDTGSVHEYEILNTDQPGFNYIQNFQLGSGATTGLETHTYTDRDIYIAIGTSITEGFNDTVGGSFDNHDFDGYAWRAARALGFALCNVGRNSATVASNAAGEYAAISVSDASKVALITCEFGTNDAAALANEATFQSTLEDLYEDLAADYPLALIFSLGILPSTRDAEDAATYSQLKEDAVTAVANARVLYRDTGTNGGTEWIDPDTDLADTVHPSIAGHVKIAAKVVQLIADNLTLNQTANTDPVTELVRRRAVGSGSLADAIIQHSGPYPSQPSNGYEYGPVRGNGDHILVFPGTITLATAQASRNDLDPL